MSERRRKATMREALDRIVTEVREVASECHSVAYLSDIPEAERRTWKAVSQKLERIAHRALYQEPLA